jgi:tetrapyrrole methylase family protein/MazG family protein/ATP diphosphatase
MYANATTAAKTVSATPRRNAWLAAGSPGGCGADVVDIRQSQCSLPDAMPEATPPAVPEPLAERRPDATELPRFDEDAPRPVSPIGAQDGTTLSRLVGVMRRLLAPDGCPWDREQTYASLRKYVLEEACEVIDAIDSGSRAALREELGDLLLQVVFQAELARREGSFAIDDVVSGIVDKLVSRHPHVFGHLEAKDADEVLRNWEKLKAREKGQRGILAGVPRSMPALTRAQRIGEKVARVGFDWEDAAGSRAKVAEEIGELDRAIAAGDAAAVEEEMGDALFALVNLSRHVGVDAEGALRRTIDKFTTRFAHVETRVRELHGGWGEAGGGERHIPLEVLDRYWEEAKRGEAVPSAHPDGAARATDAAHGGESPGE